MSLCSGCQMDTILEKVGNIQYWKAAPLPVKLLNSNRKVCPKSIFYYCGCIKNARGQIMFFFIISVTFWNTSAKSGYKYLSTYYGPGMAVNQRTPSFHGVYLLIFLSKYVNKNSHFRSAQLVFNQVTFPEQPPEALQKPFLRNSFIITTREQ